MKVLMLTYSFYESDARVQQYARALVDRGDLVDVISLRREGQPAQEVINGVNVFRIQRRKRNEKGQISYASKILLFLFRSLFRLSRRHLKNRYQLIHVHNVPDFLVFAALIPKLTGTPLILDIHDILPEFYASKFQVRHTSVAFRLLLLVERWSIAFVDHVIIANHLWYKRLVSRSVGAEKCTAICNYPGPIFFLPHPRTRNDGKFIMIYPGTLNWHQGVDIAIKAFARVTNQIPDAEFHIYGEGPTKESLIALTRELQLEKKIIFKEYVSTEQIAGIMREADLGIVPKRASPFGNEAHSTKVLEFMALGIPVIAAVTKITTFYHDDTRVKFFESDNEADLAQCMLLLRREPHAREQLIRNGTSFARQNSWAVRRKDYLDLVDAVVRSPEQVHQHKVSQPDRP